MRPLLVLWDVDYTLVATGRVGSRLYELVLAEEYGLSLPANLTSMAGRTDTSIALEVLRAARIPNPAGELARFQDALAARAPGLHSMVRDTGRVLPGVESALIAIDDTATRSGELIVQSLLTGNIPALAQVKLGALGLAPYVELDIGAYGDVSQHRADLVPVARQNAAARYGADFSGHGTVLIGDTPKDIEAAASHGARSVGVATGSFTLQQLIDAGAGVVLPDLTDTRAALGAVLDYQAPETRRPERAGPAAGPVGPESGSGAAAHG